MTATLSFARYRYSGDAGDLQYVVVVSGTVADYLVYDHANAMTWLPAQFDLKPYAGNTVKLRFSVYNNGVGGSTGMLVDDVAAQVCTP